MGVGLGLGLGSGQPQPQHLLRLELPRPLEQRRVLGEPIAHEVAPATGLRQGEAVADGVAADERGHEQHARPSRHFMHRASDSVRRKVWGE